MPAVNRYELHGNDGERPAKFISITCQVRSKKERHFVELDHALLSATLQQLLGVDPVKDTLRIKDQEADDLMADVERAAIAKDLGRYRMLIVHISSYGDPGHVYSRDCEKVAINDIIDAFRGSSCQLMVAKPKWFIIQACTEGLYDARGTETECDASLLTPEAKVTYVPSEADILTTISEVPGNVPWRKKGSNSPFIEALCTAMKEDVNKDIPKIFTRTLQKIHKEVETNVRGKDEEPVLPYMTSTLTQVLSFGTVYASLPLKK